MEYIFNQCILKSIWPNCLKSAEIVPIFKSGDKHFSENYRLISLISNFANILEKLTHNRLIKFLNTSNILANKQFGFRRNKGNNDALSFVTNTIYNNISDSIPTIATFLDLKKAFDTVNYNILFKKLHYYGLRGSILDLLKDYLTNRVQKVRQGKIYSTSR